MEINEPLDRRLDPEEALIRERDFLNHLVSADEEE